MKQELKPTSSTSWRRIIFGWLTEDKKESSHSKQFLRRRVNFLTWICFSATTCPVILCSASHTVDSELSPNFDLNPYSSIAGSFSIASVLDFSYRYGDFNRDLVADFPFQQQERLSVIVMDFSRWIGAWKRLLLLFFVI